MRISKKILACVLAALMTISMMPFTALAYTATGETFEKEVDIWGENADDFDYTFDIINETPVTDSDVFSNVRWEIKEDIVVTSPIVIPAGADVQIDLQGHSISGNIADEDGKKLFQVYGTLEFVGENGGCIYNTNTAGQGHAACQALTGGTVIVSSPIHFGDSDTNMTNANNTNRGCGIQNNGGTLIINDGYYTSIDANYTTGAWAYAILNCAGETTVNNATVYGNNLHGALGCEDGTFTVNGGTFAVNGANNYYSLYADGGDFIVNGGTFTDNSKHGVNYLGTGSEISITGGTFNYSSSTPFVQSGSKSNPVLTGGTFSSDVTNFIPANYAQDDFGKVLSLDGKNVMFTNTAGKSTYQTFGVTISSNGTYKLLSDVNVTARITPSTFCSNFVIDLNGHTLTSSAADNIFQFGRAGKAASHKTYSIINTADEKGYVIGTGDEAEGIYLKAKYNDVTIGSNVEITTKKAAVWADSNGTNSTVVINGDVEATDDYAVYVHGQNAGPNSITINGNVTGESAGIYAAGIATYYINGNVTGDTGIYVKQGTVNVNEGAKVKGVGPKADYVQYGNGFYSTGDAIAADSMLSTDPTVNVAANATLESDFNKGYQAYPEESTAISNISPDAIIIEHNIEDTMSITVADDIDLNINIDTSDAEVATVEYIYSNPDNDDAADTKTVTKSAKNDVTSFTVSLAPAQVMDSITAVAKDSEGNVVRTVSTSIADYCNTIINSETTSVITAELKDLAKATLDYGKAAAEYFDYNTDAAWTSSDLGDPTTDIADLASAAGKGTYDNSLFYIKNVSYVAKSEPELRFYFNSEIPQNTLSSLNDDMTCNNGKAKFVKLDVTGDYILQVKDIDITDFNKKIVVKIGENTILEFTPIVWVNAAIKKSGTELSDLGKAIGNYYLKAVGYFGENA